MTGPRLRAALLTAALLALGACAHDDEFAFATGSANVIACAPNLDGGPSIPGFGCASEANLRAMVVDARDLDGGREMSAPGGEAALAAVRRHRAGEIKLAAPPTANATDTTTRPGS